MFIYKLTLAYDGTRYSGWQIQPNASSIQEHLQQCLKDFLRGNSAAVIGSGRTDAGVHALNQVAHFKTSLLCEPERLQRAFNGCLPRDIRVKKIEVAPPSFHAQYSAIGKTYHYHLYLDRVMDPFRQLYCWHVLRRLEIARLEEAAAQFVGTHDFTSFANEAHIGTASRDPVRTLYRLDIRPEEGGVRLECEGDGFLYKMVRNIVGTLVDVACGRLNVNEISRLFAARDRRSVGCAAPPQGLFLASVKYPEDH